MTHLYHELILDKYNDESLDDVVGCVRSIERETHVKLGAADTEERADRDLEESNNVSQNSIEIQLAQDLHCSIVVDSHIRKVHCNPESTVYSKDNAVDSKLSIEDIQNPLR